MPAATETLRWVPGLSGTSAWGTGKPQRLAGKSQNSFVHPTSWSSPRAQLVEAGKTEPPSRAPADVPPGTQSRVGPEPGAPRATTEKWTEQPVPLQQGPWAPGRGSTWQMQTPRRS